MIPIVITAIAIVNAVFLFLTLPFPTTITNEKGKKVLSKFGVRCLIGLFIFILLPLIQYFFQEKETAKSENRIVSDLTLSYQQSVKQIQNNSNKNYDKTISTLSTNLGYYKLALDSTKSAIVDSFPPPTKPKIPILKILDISDGSAFKLSKKDSSDYKFEIPFYSSDATTCCYNIKGYIVGYQKDSGYRLIKSLARNMIARNETILQNTSMVFSTTIKSIKEDNFIYLIAIGTYKDPTTKKTYAIRDVSFYDFKEKTSGWIDGEEKEKIIAAIKQ
jgi:hypothetical protein